MKYIILIGDENFKLEIIKSIKHFDSISTYDVNENRYCVDYGTDHIFYDEEDISADYDKSDLKIYIDNGYGTIVPVQEFIRLGLPADGIGRG